MAHQKLSVSVINAIKSAIASELRVYRFLVAYGYHPHVFPVRHICKQAGISHTTYYRWLRAYRALVGKRGKLTDREKLIRKFGDVIDAAHLEVSTIPVDKVRPMLDKKRTSAHRNAGAAALLRTRASQVVLDWEERTDALTVGVDCADFRTLRFTK